MFMPGNFNHISQVDALVIPADDKSLYIKIKNNADNTT